MKHILPLMLAFLFLAACGDTTVETSTPSPATANPDPIYTPTPTSALDNDGSSDNPYGMPDWALEEPQLPLPEPGVAYTYRNEELGIELPIPAEIASAVSIDSGIDGYTGDGITFRYLPGATPAWDGVLFSILCVPRQSLFDRENWFYHVNVSVKLICMSRDFTYLRISSVGGSHIAPNAYLGAYMALDELSYAYIEDNMTVSNPDSIPQIETGRIESAANKLSENGSLTITRAEAAQLFYDAMTADNKDAYYNISFSDAPPSADHGKAIAYLASYGIISQDDLFRPDDLITRAEFVALLQRALFILYPEWLGKGMQASDCDNEHWAYNYLNCAVRDGWLLMDGDKIEPDEPVTSADAANMLVDAKSAIG